MFIRQRDLPVGRKYSGHEKENHDREHRRDNKEILKALDSEPDLADPKRSDQRFEPFQVLFGSVRRAARTKLLRSRGIPDVRLIPD